MTTIYAIPTKEIIIPPRPRPGRKPKKISESTTATSSKLVTGTSLTADDDYEDLEDSKPKEKEKQLKNREAQRKFRERERDRVADLLDRIAILEQGEGEKAKEYQEHARKYKEQNDALREENEALKLKDIQRAHHFATMQDKIRMLEETIKMATSVKRSVEDGEGAVRPAKSRKRPRTFRAGSAVSNSTSSEVSYAPTVESATSMRSSLVTPKKPSASVKFALPSTSIHCLESTHSGVSPAKNLHEPPAIPSTPTNTTRCGMCMKDMPCLCSGARAHYSLSSAPKAPSSSILDHLPPYAPAVPLRRLRSSNTAAATVAWIVNPAPALAKQKDLDDPADCTGDPANCLACADDPANQAFCAALGDTHGPEGEDEFMRPATPIGASHPSTSQVEKDIVMELESQAMTRSLPSSRMSISTLCCGNPQFCGGGCAASNEGSATLVPLPLSSSYDQDDRSILPQSFQAMECEPGQSENYGQFSEKDALIPCNVAWRQLKSHPQIDKADLTLLADVVARTEYLPSASRAGSTSAYASSGSSSHAHVAAGASSAMSSSMSLSSSGTNGSTSTALTSPSVSSSSGTTDTSRMLVPHDQLLMHHSFSQRRRVTHVSKQGLDEGLGLLEGLKSLR